MNTEETTDYQTYREAAQIVLGIPGVYKNTGLILSEETQWAPWPPNIEYMSEYLEILEFWLMDR